MESKLGTRWAGTVPYSPFAANCTRPCRRRRLTTWSCRSVGSRGYRAVFEPAAVGIEPQLGNFGGEFRRKRRIVDRSWHGVMSVSEVLNPERLGWFAWQVWSHKVLRWLVSAARPGGGRLLVAAPLGLHYRLGAWGFVASLALAGIGAFAPARWGRAATLLHAAWYFYLVNLAAVLGMAMALMGRVEMIWTPNADGTLTRDDAIEKNPQRVQKPDTFDRAAFVCCCRGRTTVAFLPTRPLEVLAP